MSRNAATRTALADAPLELDLELAQEVPLASLNAPGEPFLTLRTRLEQMQAAQAIRTVLITSPAPGEGKSFIASNLALAQVLLPDNPTLLCDFNLRKPGLHQFFGMGRSPGISDYLLGHVDLPQALRRIGASDLFVMPAGEAVINPLELLHVKELGALMNRLRSAFRWIILDSPSLAAASDANLLAALTDGALLVTRIGATTPDSMNRAVTSLGQNHVLGLVANATPPGR